MSKNILLMPLLASMLESICPDKTEELKGIDIDQEYEKIQAKSSALSKSMRDLVIRVYKQKHSEKGERYE